MSAWPPQASYPCGNFSDTSSLKLVKSLGSRRIDRPHFRGPSSYWKAGAGQLLPFCSTRGFCPRWAGLRTPALRFDRCTAPVKLPAWRGPRFGSQPSAGGTSPPVSSGHLTLASREPGRAGLAARSRPDSRYSRLTELARKRTKVVVFHWRPGVSPVSHLYYTSHVSSQRQTRVKLNRVFFPRRFSQARSLGCGFAR